MLYIYHTCMAYFDQVLNLIQVDIEINGEPQDIHMKLGESGEAFFVEEIQGSDNDEIPEHLATSPIPAYDFEKLYTPPGRRRNSIDLGENKTKPVFENQVNDYTKRRNTADSENQSSTKKREQEFLERQIVLGNIELCENSTEDLTLSLQSNTKISSDDISNSKETDFSETIFRMDSLEMENSKSEGAAKPEEQTKIATTPIKQEEVVLDTKSGKKKRRKRSLMKKKNSQRRSLSVNELSTTTDSLQDASDLKTSDFGTDRSSLDSNASDPELKQVQ